jgi:hypothetical protein
MNVMGHVAGGTALNVDGRIPRFISGSQVNTINDFLGRDVEFDQDKKDLWLTEAGALPVGAIPNGLTSLRTKLGKTKLQRWSHWEKLGGAFASAPAAASWSPGRLDVFVRGTNDHLMHKWWNGSAWSHWEDLEGDLSEAPAAVSWDQNRIDCFIRGADNELWHKWTWLG